MSLPDIAELGFSVNSKPAVDGAQDLDKLTAATGRAEGATTKLTATQRAFGQSTTAAFSPVRDAAQAVKMLEAEEKALIATQQRLNAVHGSAVGSSKALQQATLGLTRQAADVGVQLAGGTPFWLVLIQQGPQVADGFAVAAQQGLGLKAVLAGLYAQAAPLIAIMAPLIIAAGAVGSVFALSARQINEENKGLINSMGLTKDQLEDVKNKTVTMGDVAVGTFNAVKGALAEAFGPELKAAGKAMDEFLDNLAKNTVKELKAIVGGFMGAYGAITATWKMLPAAFGDATISAANLALAGLQKLINGAIGLINPLIEGMNARFKLSIPTLPQAQIAKLSNQYAGAMSAVGKAATAAMAKGLADGSGIVDRTIGAIGAETLKAARARIKKEAGDGPKAAQATKDQADALMKLDDSLVGVIEKEIRMSDAVKVANDNTRTMNDTLGNFRVPSDLENLITALEQSREAAYNVARSIDDILYSIRGNDWAGAFSGLLRTLDQVTKAFEKGATAQEKLSAIAGIGMGIGSAVGGTAGAGISGAASGALAGGAFAGSKLGTAIMPGLGTVGGAAVGALLGGLSSLFSSSSAKKKQKADEEAAKAAAEAARQQEILNQKRALEIDAMEAQGWSFVALTMRRADELAKMNEANRASAVALHALQDAATFRELELKLIEATSGAEATLDARRHTQLAGMNPLNHAIQQQIWAEDDLKKARVESAAQAEQEARAAQERADAQQAIVLDLMAMDDAVTGGNTAVLAQRELELATLDPASQALKRIYYARLDEGAAIEAARLATERKAEADAAAAEAATRALAAIEEAIAASVAATNQARPYMLRLLEMDDAVLGTTTALIAKRADELAGLGPLAQELAKIVWAREDEGAIMAANAKMIEDQAAAVSTARDVLSQAYERETSAIGATRDKMAALAKTLRDLSGSISGSMLENMGPQAQYDASRSAFFEASALARLGNTDAAERLPALTEAFKSASLVVSPTELAYARDLALMRLEIEAAASTADRQVSLADRQLEALRDQVSGLIDVNESVLSVEAAIANLAAAMGASKAIAPVAGSTASGGDLAGFMARTDAYAAEQAAKSAAQIATEYAATMAEGLSWLDSMWGGYAGAYMQATGGRTNSLPGFANGGSFMIGGNPGIDQNIMSINDVPVARVGMGETVSVSPGAMGGGNAELIGEIRALRSEVADLKAAAIQTTINTGKSARLADRWDGDGLPPERAAA